MVLSERMQGLQDAMVRYSKLTIKNFRAVHAFGDAIVERLPHFLGEGAEVIGVPPLGDYKTNGDDYRDAKFSTYTAGTLTLAPIQMGVAVGIPHKADDGRFWPRVVVEFEMIGDAIAVSVGDGPARVRGVPMPHTIEDVEKVCAEIHEYIRSVLENPVKVATAVGRGKLGFI
ncbi:MAG: hypothetical protein J0H42_26815 [Rhizobiales bacterium]|nr:hypothetical protein [Hyphomicrobiales bacterium]